MSVLKYNINKYGRDADILDRNVKIFNGQPKEVFSNARTVKMIIGTVNGVKVFDSTNVERVATHKIHMLFKKNITSENWIKFNNKNVKILTVENCCEKDDVLILMCSERGLDSVVVNEA